MDCKEYRREGTINYIRLEIIPCKDEDYETEILMHNQLDGLLRVGKRRINQKEYLYYEIASMQSMRTLWEGKKLIRKDVEEFLKSVREVNAILISYMLEPIRLELNPGFVYGAYEKGRWKFLVNPYKDSDEDVLELTEFLLDHMDESEEEFVQKIYEVYDLMMGGNDTSEGHLDMLLHVLIEEERDSETKDEVVENENIVESSCEAMYEVTNSDEGSVLSYWMRVLPFLCAAIGIGMIGLYLLVDLNGMEQILVLAGFVSILLIAVGSILWLKREKRRQQESVENVLQNRVEMQEDSESNHTKSVNSVILDKEERTQYFEAVSRGNGKLYGIGRNKQVISLEKLPCVVGKAAEYVDQVLSDSSISRIHVKFYSEAGVIWMEDLNSTNGIIKNGLRVEPNGRTMLETEDEISIGRLAFVYR